jgi:CRP-like cAMP-binding protein
MKKTLYLLAELSVRDFEWLIKVGKRQKIPTGRVLIHEGEPITAVYMLLAGELSVLAEAVGGEELARLSRGEWVGEISFVDARPPSATVKATQDSIVWVIPRIELMAKLSADTAFAAHFYQGIALFLADRLRSTVSRLGYEKHTTPDPHRILGEEPEEKVNPATEETLKIAQMRLDWLLNNLQNIG